MLGRGVSGVWGSCLRPLRPGVLAPDVDSRGLPFTEPLPCKKMEQSKPKSKDRVHRGKSGSAGRWDEQGSAPGGWESSARRGWAQGQGRGEHSPAYLRWEGEKEGTGKQEGQGPARQDGQARKPGAGSGLGTRTGKDSLPGPEGMGCGWEHGGFPAPTYLSRGSWLLPSRGRCRMAAERGLGLWGLTASKAVAGVEALLLRGGGGGLPSFLGPAPLLPALPSAACCPIPWGRWGPRPRSAIGCWPGENGSQSSDWGWADTDLTQA